MIIPGGVGKSTYLIGKRLSLIGLSAGFVSDVRVVGCWGITCFSGMWCSRPLLLLRLVFILLFRHGWGKAEERRRGGDGGLKETLVQGLRPGRVFQPQP